jgi:hypothetical protein
VGGPVQPIHSDNGPRARRLDRSGGFRPTEMLDQVAHGRGCVDVIIVEYAQAATMASPDPASDHHRDRSQTTAKETEPWA